MTSIIPSSLLAALNCRGNTHLVIGTNPLAATRCTQSLSSGAKPILIAPEGSELHYALQKKIDDGSVQWHRKKFEDADLLSLGREEVDGVVDAVFVTSGPRDPQSLHISALCKRNRIPVNVVDAPQLCTFSLLSTHTDGPLQIGVTTNGRGCKLASRIRRDIAASLPVNLGAACTRLGDVRRRIHDEDSLGAQDDPASLDDSYDQNAEFNRLITEEDAKNRRVRWLSQVCEYWPLKRLAAITDNDVETVLKSYPGNGPDIKRDPHTPEKRVGTIILAGSGPGHPDLLTQATHKAIKTADLILADKLVPSGVLDLIPRRTPVQIARKFPGNADRAQEELLEMALAGVQQGKTVLRLKQGDPYVYGRGGEEVAYFRQHGFGDRVSVLPGVTSALSAPLFAAIPPTQRDVADQILICTGTGKKGKAPSPPEFVPSRTVVFLMALHRIHGLIRELTTHIELEPLAPANEEAASAQPPPPPEPTQVSPATGESKRVLWPRNTPCAVIERASCPDQRVIRTTLEHVAEAIETEGSRPPGLLVVGRSCETLFTPEKGRAWVVEEGFRGMEIEDFTVGLEALQA
ncbi:uroporphyrin-III C-methyltransferase precorrin-2 dehydrogenase sirohydrochlorin ferrochelatase [Fusarium pseudocircinatum]|uniref:precorrin-2 dehydrogenase n=1 Tax=Fusarium pseudocircinatum TaxID=56676 RepID=A0A8H5L3V8_9HYPO|nr:uroporphyrin-III C-methyltransferase precorrin-2 dehydrogenase sirohydrochlorin ferrochelatase [Fusarium pseudocircinatum]